MRRSPRSRHLVELTAEGRPTRPDYRRVHARTDCGATPAGAGDLLHEPADRRHGRRRSSTSRCRRSAATSTRRCPGCSGRRRLHPGAGEPAHAVAARPPTGSAGAACSRPASRCSPSARCCAAWRPGSAGWSRSGWCRPWAARCSTRWPCRSSPTSSPSPRERARAIGVWGGVVGTQHRRSGRWSAALLVESVGWRAIFWINVPVGLAAIVLAALFVPESRAAGARRLDPVGQLLVMVVLASAHLRDHRGAASPAGLAADRRPASWPARAGRRGRFVPYEPRRREPLIDLRFFRSVPFSGATVIAVCAFGGVRRLPVPEHPLPAGRARLHRRCTPGCCTLPMAVMTLVCRAAVRPDRRHAAAPRLPLVLAGVAHGARRR